MNSLVKQSIRCLCNNPSYVHGACSVPFINSTVGKVMRDNELKIGDRDLFLFPKNGISKTYSEVLKDSETLASGLLAIGLNRGDRVGIWAPNVYEWVVTQFATSLAGLVLVTINPGYKVHELKHCLKKVGIRAIVSAGKFKTQDYYSMLVEACPEIAQSKPGQIESKDLPDLKHVAMIGCTNPKPGTWSYEDVLSAGDSNSLKLLQEVEMKIQPDDPVNIQFTSGTTGTPKGATLSHHNIINNAYSLGFRIGYAEMVHKICCPPPLFHCFGCVGGSLASVIHGCTTIFPSPSFEPQAALQAVHDYHCTSLYGTPTMFIDMLNHESYHQYEYNSLTTGIMAGAPAPPELFKNVVNKLHMKDFLIGYGTTENSPLSFMSSRNESPEMRANNVGHVMDHQEAKIINSDGEMVPKEITGELLTRGYMVMLKYWNDKEMTRATVTEDGWYHSGDLAEMNENGSVKIVGRLKDMIIRGGENIYPVEIEDELFQFKPVAQALVFGVPDERLGEEICAWIVLKCGFENTSEDDVREYCREDMAHFKIPHYIQFKTLDQIPMTVSGKPQKHLIRDIACIELGLENVKPLLPK